MYVKCPHCRTRFFVSDKGIEITPRQRSILEAIPEVAHNSRSGLATTFAIAARVNWAERTVRYELAHLEHLKEVRREGKRGWALNEKAVMMVA
jgi:Mn-dependent DtxR family transcriptional regulator